MAWEKQAGRMETKAGWLRVTPIPEERWRGWPFSVSLNKVRALAELAELTDLGTPWGIAPHSEASVEPQGVLVFTHPLERGLGTRT